MPPYGIPVGAAAPSLVGGKPSLVVQPIWPPVQPTDWCGEWHPAAAEPGRVVIPPAAVDRAVVDVAAMLERQKQEAEDAAYRQGMQDARLAGCKNLGEARERMFLPAAGESFEEFSARRKATAHSPEAWAAQAAARGFHPTNCTHLDDGCCISCADQQRAAAADPGRVVIPPAVVDQAAVDDDPDDFVTARAKRDAMRDAEHLRRITPTGGSDGQD